MINFLLSNQVLYRIWAGILFGIILVTRKIYENRAEAQAKDGLAQDLDDKFLIALESLLLTVSLVAIIAYIINPIWVRWSGFGMRVWFRGLGMGIGALGTGLLVWSHIVLGSNFYGGLKLGRDHVLVVNGPYHWIRHPIYTAFLAIGVGFTLMTGNALIGGTWLGSTLLVIFTRMDPEEQMLVQRFGAEYQAYQDRTRKLLPKFFGNSSQ